jgi:hypothetical protein
MGSWASGYAGPAPMTEPEAVALLEFIREVRPEIVINLHSQGGFIYADRSVRPYADIVSSAIGYRNVQDQFEPWCLTGQLIGYEGIPSFTVEVGRSDQTGSTGVIRTSAYPEVTERIQRIADALPFIAQALDAMT